MKAFLLTLLVLLAVGAVLLFVESYRFNQWLESGQERIKSFQSSGPSVNREELPPLLQEYLKKVVIKEGPGNYVAFTQSGHFRMQPEDEMSHFTARQFASLLSPMFSWLAAIDMKGLTVKVCDRLVDRQGELQARLFSVIPLAKGSGDSFLRGELLRYLAELPWYPMAILKQPDIQWRQVAKNKLTATISMGHVSATVEYTLNEDYLIQSIFVPDRERAVGKTVELKPWLGEFSEYERRENVLIPLYGQVSWVLESGKFTYFKGRIVDYNVQ